MRGQAASSPTPPIPLPCSPPSPHLGGYGYGIFSGRLHATVGLAFLPCLQRHQSQSIIAFPLLQPPVSGVDAGDACGAVAVYRKAKGPSSGVE